MEVLSSRILLRPSDPERSERFYRDVLGLPVYREWGEGATRGMVFFLGGGFLELSGRTAAPASEAVQLWLQVRDLAATRERLTAAGVEVIEGPTRRPWGLLEMTIRAPDELTIFIVEVPEDHPLRRRTE